MPWTNQGGGSGGGGGGPWGGGGGGGGGGPWGQGPGGPGRPDFEDMIRRGQDRVRGALPGGFGGKGLILIGIALIIVWLLTGLYRVQAGHQGVALIFGKWWDTTLPGLHWNPPAPIGSVETPNVEFVNRSEIGIRTTAGGRSGASRDITEESLMLTGDENIIDIQFVVLWKIKDAGQFLFNIRNPAETVKNVAESAMREVIGRTEFEFARTRGRAAIQGDAKTLIQETLDAYGSGILVTSIELQKVDPPSQVIDAFRDVQAARADKERAVNEAQAYLNEVTQRAQGEAEQILRSAEAYKEERIAIATGEADRFLAVLKEYRDDPEVTRQRIYWERMEQVMGNINKIVIGSGQGDSLGTVPYLPLNELLRNQPGRGKDGTAGGGQ